MKVQEIKVRITLTEPMLGTVPKNKEVYRSYIASKTPLTPEQVEEEVETVPEDLENKGWTGYHQDKTGIFVYDYLFRGFLKNAATVLKESTQVKNAKSKVSNFLFVFPRRLYITRDNEILQKPEELLERPLRAETAQGPRVTLARSDVVNEGVSFEATIKILAHKEIDETYVKELLDYGQFSGLGQWRNASYGRFTYEILK